MSDSTPEAWREAADARYEVGEKAFQEAAKERRDALPLLVAEDYVFERTDGSIRLSECFEGKSDLILIHNMGRSCPYCTMWADGINGMQDHLRDRAGLVLITPDAPADAEAFAKSRGWTLPIASTGDSGFIEAMEMGTQEHPWPGISTFHRDASGTITRIAVEAFGPFDLYSPVWHVLGRLKDGVNGWEPKVDYSEG